MSWRLLRRFRTYSAVLVLLGFGAANHALAAVADPTPTITPLPTVPPLTPTPTASPTPTATPKPTVTPYPTPTPSPTPATWVDAQQNGTIAYFAFGGSSPRVERYDMQQQVWLQPITLSAAPTAFSVDNTGLYVSFGTSTDRIALDGSTSQHLIDTSADVIGSVVSGDILYLNSGQSWGSAHWTSINKTSALLIASKDYSYSVRGLSIARSRNRIFGRSTSVSPSDIIEMDVTSDGQFGQQKDSPYHGTYPDAQRTFVFPDETRVTDSAGIVYATSDLSYVNTFAGGFYDLAFYGSVPVVLRDKELTAYSNAFTETGRYALATQALRVFVYGDGVFCFANDPVRGVAVTRVAVSLLSPQPPNSPVDPTNLNYTPDAIALGNGGIIYLLHVGTSNVFRWSIQQQRYLASIPLTDVPRFMAYSDSSNSLFIAYPSGRLTMIPLSTSTAEQPVASLPQAPTGLSAAGDFLFATDPSGAWGTHYIFDTNTGALLSSKEWENYSREHIWSPENHRMYFFRDDTSPNDLLWEEIDTTGNLGTEKDSPYHDSTPWAHPIRVASGGAYVIVGTGRIFDAITMSQIGALPTAIDDAAWMNDQLFTMSHVDAYTQVKSWSSGYSNVATAQFNGTPLRLVATKQTLVAIVETNQRPAFTLLNNNLQTEASAPAPAAPLANISTRVDVGADNDVLIGGFIVTGSGSKKVALRGLGPSLAAAGVANPLDDPTLELHDSSGAVIATNDNWRDAGQTQIAELGLAPADDRESALIAVLPRGAYTVVLRGKNSSSGVGLVEVYDLNSDSNSATANISTRAIVHTGDRVMIGGFIVAANNAGTKVLLRAIGPSLGSSISNALQDPQLELHDGNGSLIAANDNWRDGQPAEVQATGIPPADDRESALVQSLAPGNYTAIVRGAADSTGVGLVEVYNLQ